ncbi:hypothetical protein ACSBR2_040533 [Camellia fascicularis]
MAAQPEEPDPHNRPTQPTHNRRTTLRPPPLSKSSTFLSGSELRSLSQSHSKIINILALNSPNSEQRPPSQTSRIGAPSESAPLMAERGLQGQCPGGGDLRQPPPLLAAGGEAPPPSD